MPAKLPLRPLSCPQWHSRILSSFHLPPTHLQSLPPPFLLPFLSRPAQAPTSQFRRPTPSRLFTTTTPHNGGKNKSNHARANAKLASTDADPVDFTDYTTAITSVHENLRAELGKISIAALDVTKVEELKVRLKNDVSSPSGKAGGGTRRGEGKKIGGAAEGGGVVGVSEIASVYRRGRDIVVAASEKEYLKPLLASLASLSSTTSPIQSPTSPLEIHLPIPQTTSESRGNAAKEAQEKGQAALEKLNAARGEHKKKLKAVWLKKEIGGEELKKLEVEMEKKNKAAGEEVKKLVDEGKRRLERL